MSYKQPPWDNLPVPYTPRHHTTPRPTTRRQVIVIEEPITLPEFMKRLSLLSKKCAKVRTLLSLAGKRFLPRSPLLANFVTDRRNFPDSLG